MFQRSWWPGFRRRWSQGKEECPTDRGTSLSIAQERRKHLRHELYDEKVDSLITPTAVSIPSISGTTSSVSSDAHTSRVSRTSRRWGAGLRGSKECARAPRSRLRTGRTVKKRMPRLRSSSHTKVQYSKERRLAKMGPKKGRWHSYRPSNSGRNSRHPAGTRNRAIRSVTLGVNGERQRHAL